MLSPVGASTALTRAIGEGLGHPSHRRAGMGVRGQHRGASALLPYLPEQRAGRETSVEEDDAADDAALEEVLVALVDLVEGVGLGD